MKRSAKLVKKLNIQIQIISGYMTSMGNSQECLTSNDLFSLNKVKADKT